MTQSDASSLLVMGGIFFFLGIAAVVWDRLEKKGYFKAISTHEDIREFLSGWPPRAEIGAIRVGGWIAIVLGLIVAGIAVWFKVRG